MRPSVALFIAAIMSLLGTTMLWGGYKNLQILGSGPDGWRNAIVEQLVFGFAFMLIALALALLAVREWRTAPVRTSFKGDYPRRDERSASPES